MKISVVIPVYKNKKMFLKNMKHNAKYLKGFEVVVVDDASHVDLKKDIVSAFPWITVIENEVNVGFAKTVNVGFKKAKGELVILLNSDVRLTSDFSKELFKKFENDQLLFAVSFLQESNGRKLGKNTIQFRKGFPIHDKAVDLNEGLNAWANGGSSIIRKSYFDELEGFNELYSPFYWEDIDLSYRAYAQGWKVLFDPSIIVNHSRGSTVEKYFKISTTQTIAFRNQFIFAWINLPGILLMTHAFYLPLHILLFALRGDMNFFRGFAAAIMKIDKIARYRRKKFTNQKVSDIEILGMFNNEK